MTWRSFRNLIRRWIPLMILLPLVYLLRPVFWTPLDHRFYNYFHSKKPVQPWSEVVVVAIDNATKAKAFDDPIYPLSRHVNEHARLTAKLNDAGVRAIVFDLRLTEDVFDSPPHQLTEAFHSAKNVFLAMSLTESRNSDSFGGEYIILQGILPHPELVAASEGAFLVDIQVDSDGILRRFHPDPRIERLDTESLPEHLAGLKVRESVPIEFPSEDRPIPTVSYLDALNGGDEVKALVAGRIAFVGSVLDEAIDYVAIPRMQRLDDGRSASLLPGVSALAAITETLMRGSPIRDAGWLAVLLWNILWCAAAIMLMPKGKPIQGALILCAVIIASLFVTGVLHSLAGFVFPAGLLLGCLVSTSGYILIASHLQTTKDLLQALQISHDELELIVEARTVELSKTNDELNQAIQKLKSTQAQLIQSEKMASLGNLVAGIAHEVNNPVGAVHSSADVSLRCVKTIENAIQTGDVEANKALRRALEVIKENTLTTTTASGKIAGIVKSLKNFARLDEADLQAVDVHEGIDNTLILLNHELREKVTVTKEYGEIPPIRCFPGELNQLFMNVLLNACQAIENKGTISIRTHTDKTNVYISIHDDGVGIPPENVSKVFDPGFTTKGVRVGAGLGLSISYNIIKKHKGEIRIDSRPGEGSTFTIVLPQNVI